MQRKLKVILGAVAGAATGVALVNVIRKLNEVDDFDFEGFDEDEIDEFEDLDISEEWDDAGSLGAKTATVQVYTPTNPLDNKFVKEALGVDIKEEDFNLKEKAGADRDDVVMEILSLSSIYTDEFLKPMSDLGLWVILYQLRELQDNKDK